MERALRPHHASTNVTPNMFKTSHTQAIERIIKVLEAEHLSDLEISGILNEVKYQLHTGREYPNEVITPEELSALLGFA